jgi:hypothetical protein
VKKHDVPFFGPAADPGVHTFVNVILRRRGKQTITVTDTLNSALTATDSINVG